MLDAMHCKAVNTTGRYLQIAVQMAVVFAKVARVDYPRAWPSLFTDLLQQMQSLNTLMVRRVYLVLHHALKELASKRLSSDQKAFAEASGAALPVPHHAVASAFLNAAIIINTMECPAYIRKPMLPAVVPCIVFYMSDSLYSSRWCLTQCTTGAKKPCFKACHAAADEATF